MRKHISCLIVSTYVRVLQTERICAADALRLAVNCAVCVPAESLATCSLVPVPNDIYVIISARLTDVFLIPNCQKQ
jgi:hypothetical protein